MQLPGAQDLINRRMRGKTCKWKLQYKLVRLLVALGNKRLVIQAVSHWPGQTPIGSAARNSNQCVMRNLMRAGADPKLKNDRGFTPLRQITTLLQDTKGGGASKQRSLFSTYHKSTRALLLS